MSSFLFKNTVIQTIITSTLRKYIEFTLKTTRWQFDIDPSAHPLLIGQKGQTALVVFWHEMLILTPTLLWWAQDQNQQLKMYVLISRNHDGQLITKIIKSWKAEAVRGSSSKNGQDKGGAAALRQLIQLSKDGNFVTITPDGPKGPRRQVNPGLIKLALLSKTKIVPFGAYCRCFRLESWDRLMIPLPFGKGRFICTAPIEVNKENYDDAIPVITAALNEAMEKARQ